MLDFSKEMGQTDTFGYGVGVAANIIEQRLGANLDQPGSPLMEFPSLLNPRGTDLYPDLKSYLAAARIIVAGRDFNLISEATLFFLVAKGWSISVKDHDHRLIPPEG